MPRRKTDAEIGMEVILNNKDTSFLKNPATFNAILSESKMSITQIMRHLGKGKNTKTEPSDKEKSEQRLQNLETNVKK